MYFTEYRLTWATVVLHLNGLTTSSERHINVGIAV